MQDVKVEKDIGKFNKFRWSLVAVYFIFNILLIFTYQNPSFVCSR